MAMRAKKPMASAVGLEADVVHAIATDSAGYQERLAAFREAEQRAGEAEARAKERLAAAEAAEQRAQTINAANVEAGSKLAAERAAIAEDRAELEKAQAEINDRIVEYKELVRVQTEREQAVIAARDAALNAVKELLG